MAKRVASLRNLLGGAQTTNEKLSEAIKAVTRVAMPGIITGFNTTEQTVSVKPAIMENVIDDSTGAIVRTEFPELLDVPIVFPRSGGFSLTMPINVGDECLVIFADMCIDAWWASGGIQAQEDIRRHDLSDAFAIIGTWSQAKKVVGMSTTKARLVHEASGNGVEVTSTGVNLLGTVTINGVNMNTHKHTVLVSGTTYTTSNPT